MAFAIHEQDMPSPVAVRIDRADLPDFGEPVGMFGSRSNDARGDASDDIHAELMSCLHPFHREG